ncbi:MAG: isoprenylcysteine carboxylmethyltransferase family protein [Acidobacteria bacterium]|nr:MAG: isoprenylcysteine carboxylmethyltransferase family protein [Acidobacteriota bacterium]
MALLGTLSIAALLLMVLALLGLVATHSLFSLSPLALAAQLAAVALMVWARLTFGRRSFHAGANPTAGGLVTTGPYRTIRHPIYTAACLFGWAGVLANWSALSALLGLLLFIGGLGRMLCEERLVAERYPEYRDYAQVTKRVLPYLF